MAQKPINAAGIPQPQINAGWLELAAGWLNDDGTTIQTAGSDLKATWHGLSGVYHAPEAPDLFAAMDPVATATESFASDVGQVSKALKNFAAEAGPLAATLATTQSEASTFASSVSGNDKWDHDSSLVNKNNAFIHTVNTTVVLYEAAERRAANAIEALIGGTQFHTITSAADAKDPYAYGYDSIPDNTKGTPWGASVTKKDGCVKTALKDVGDVFVGAYEWGKGLVTGLGDLVGLGGWDKFKQSWEGMAFLATLVSGPIGWAEGSAMFGGPAAYAKRAEAFGKGLLDWDEWKTHPFRAATQVILNVGTLFVPGADGAGVAADIAKGADYAADAGKVADLADAGKLAKTINITKDAFATLNTITDPLHWLGQLPKVIDFANGMKFPELVGTGGKEASTLENAMKDWDHEPAPVREPVTVGGGGHDPSIGGGGHDPSIGGGGHDPATGGAGHDPSIGGGGHEPTAGGGHGPGTAHDPNPHPDPTRDAPPAHGEYKTPDGKSHYPGDPAGTSRDANGALHDSHGHFESDPNASRDQPTATAVHGQTVDHTISPAEHPAYAQQVQDRLQLVREHTTVLRERNGVASDLGVPARDLTKSKLSNTIDKLFTEHPDRADQIARLDSLSRSELRLNTSLRRSSEQLGMTAGEDVLRSRGDDIVVGSHSVAGRAHEVDLVGVSKDGKTLTVVEAKGGDSARLGERTTADGVRAQQGSPQYIEDLLQRDPRVREYLTQHPEFARALADGNVEVRYDLVVAKSNGRITITEFVIDIPAKAR